MNMILWDHIPDYESASCLAILIFSAEAKCTKAELELG